MILSGSIKLKGPGLKRQELLIDTPDGNELEVLTTKVEKGKEDADFSLTVDMIEDDISIVHEANDTRNFEAFDGFYIYMITSEKKQIGININYAQARMLKEMLENYINARNLIQKLYEPITVKAG